MTEHLQFLEADQDGMATYEYIVNNAAECLDDMPELIEHLKRIDRTGQFLASSARFLAAINRSLFADTIEQLIEGAIEKDRERRYIPSLLEAIWGADYQERAAELRLSDNNFRRIYKRVYPSGSPYNFTSEE